MKETQGYKKMQRLLDDYFRDYELKKYLKRIVRNKKFNQQTDSSEFEQIFSEFKALKKKVIKFHNKLGFKHRFATAEKYGIDGWMMDGLIANIEGHEELSKFISVRAGENDMCKVEDLYDEERHDDASDGVITLRPYSIMKRLAFPVAVSIHPGASKNDVLDFIEKRWPEIENNLRRDEPFDKALRMRKRKHSQELLDFIWTNREWKDEEIKRRLDTEFPNNGLVYNEINKLLHLELERRNF